MTGGKTMEFYVSPEKSRADGRKANKMSLAQRMRFLVAEGYVIGSGIDAAERLADVLEETDRDRKFKIPSVIDPNIKEGDKP